MYRRLPALLLCLSLLLALLCPVGSAEPAAAETVRIQLLASSDTHGRFWPWDYALDAEDSSGSMLQLATAIVSLRDENTLVLDAGDVIQDNCAELFLDREVHPMTVAMNYVGYDARTPGNHEFNYGMDVVRSVRDTSNAPFLCGNVTDEHGDPLGDGYLITERAGLRIGIIGMVTPNITHWDAMNLKDCTVTDPVVETRRIISEIGTDCDLLIALVHMDLQNEYGTPNSGVIDLANACPELDAIIAAHGHSAIADMEVNGVPIVENRNSCSTLARITLTVEKGEDGARVVDRSSELLTVADYAPDPALAELLSDAHAEGLSSSHTVIGRLEGEGLVPEADLPGMPVMQLMDTAQIDLVNEVQLYYADADVSATAVTDLYAHPEPGDLRRCDISRIYKYTNTLYRLEMTGAQLRTYMEWSAAYYNRYREGDLTVSFDPDRRSYTYDSFAGVCYDIDISQPVGSRITALTRTDGTPVRDDDVFVIVVNNYRAGSQLLSYGEIFCEEDGLPTLLDIDVRGDIGGVRELIADYIVNVKGGVLRAHTDDSWHIIGTDWDEDLHEAALEAIRNGLLTVPTSADGRTPNVRSITVEDLEAVLPTA